MFSSYVDQLIDFAASIDQLLGNICVALECIGIFVYVCVYNESKQLSVCIECHLIDGEMHGEVVAVKHQGVQLGSSCLASRVSCS